MDILERAPRIYKCRNCEHEQTITTNHNGPCFNFCDECSWKPSFGKPENAIPMFGRTYRPFDYVRELEPESN